MIHLIDSPTRTTPQAVVRAAGRLLAIVMLLTTAGIHLYLAPMHLREAPYIGALFILLAVICIALAAALVFVDSSNIWKMAGFISLAGLAAYIVSRTIGLPQIGDDIGNWPGDYSLGYLTMAAELVTVSLAAFMTTLNQMSHRAPSIDRAPLLRFRAIHKRRANRPRQARRAVPATDAGVRHDDRRPG